MRKTFPKITISFSFSWVFSQLCSMVTFKVYLNTTEKGQHTLLSWINATWSTTPLCQDTQKGLIILRGQTEAAETKLPSRKNRTLTIFQLKHIRVWPSRFLNKSISSMLMVVSAGKISFFPEKHLHVCHLADIYLELYHVSQHCSISILKEASRAGEMGTVKLISLGN